MTSTVLAAIKKRLAQANSSVPKTKPEPVKAEKRVRK